MKRLFILAAAWILLILGAGWVWSTHDQTEYAELLDHYNLSEQAVKITTKSPLTLPQAAAKLAQSDLTNVQVQFRASGARVFLYAKGSYGELPLASGQWFSDADLQSPLPVAVVGNDLSARLATGSHQQYLKQNGQYIPVLGVVSSPRSQRLNQAIFLNASGAGQAAPRLANVKIYADGANIQKQKSQLAKLLGGKASKYQYRQHLGVSDWWQTSGVTALWCVLLVLGALLIAWLAQWFIKNTLPAELKAPQRTRALRTQWVRLAGYGALLTAAGTLTANWWFYLSDRPRLVVFATSLWGLAAVALYGLIMHNSKKRERKHESA
ncbi:ABC transporter permease [Lacticaseibacillus hegangensis]|uniref:ABC transporter permease n=1 Tax=Lacticaseibacillus hegangensis TaxID=2486010 RepID=A0ABW4CTU0_9LACO|nr:ABC transporter permease [Lacticaseibacillus hegangensis]